MFYKAAAPNIIKGIQKHNQEMERFNLGSFPPGVGKIVSMTPWKDMILIACEYAVYVWTGSRLEKLEYAPEHKKPMVIKEDMEKQK